jgi:hypothetical protein
MSVHSGTSDGAHQALRGTAASATLHCLAGCAIGEILGLVIGTAAGLGNARTVVLAVGLAFFFGYLLSTLPLIRVGLPLTAVLRTVIAADTLSIATMEVVDNAVMTLTPGAMDGGLLSPRFWVAMTVALSAAYVAAYPVNLFLLGRGKGHALLHGFHHAGSGVARTGWRRWIPDLPTPALVAAIAAYLLGGLTVALTAELFDDESAGHGAPTQQPLSHGR